jgi:hypothetical protein
MFFLTPPMPNINKISKEALLLKFAVGEQEEFTRENG